MHLHAIRFQDVYQQLLSAVDQYGIACSPRGNAVTEIQEPISWTLYRSMDWALCIPGRRLNPFFALAEVVWMWSGKGGAEFITYYNKSMSNFLDPGVPYFNAAYGRRVRAAGYEEIPYRDTPSVRSNSQFPENVTVDQLEFVISKLQKDESSRQAVVSLWDPIKDNFHVSKDYPCNNLVYFLIRDGYLNVSVVIRSNDLIWGTPYNMIQFVHLQALMAGALGVRIGKFSVMCNNLHIYDTLYSETRQTIEKWHTSTAVNDVPTPVNNLPMEWALGEFDIFVRKVWEPMEKSMRYQQESFQTYDKAHKAHGAALNILLMDLEREFERVPLYWQAVFRVLFMYHLRKGKHMDSFHEQLQLLPDFMQWLITDFITREAA